MRRPLGAVAALALVLAGCSGAPPPTDEFGPLPHPDVLSVAVQNPKVTVVGAVEGFETGSALVTVPWSDPWEKIAAQPGGCSWWTRARVREPGPDAALDARADSLAALAEFALVQGHRGDVPATTVLLPTGAAEMVAPGQEPVGLNAVTGVFEGDLGEGPVELTYFVRQHAQPLHLFDASEQEEVVLVEWRLELAFACPVGSSDPAALEAVLGATRVSLSWSQEELGAWPSPVIFDEEPGSVSG